jgi:phage-related baseplate assembly protein
MPTYVSDALFIDFARLPPPDVIETIDYEEILTRYRLDVVGKNPNLSRAVGLEQSPTNIILETQSGGEMIVRARINAAARAVMLAFSTGTDLDNLGVLFGVYRLTTPADNTVSPPIAAGKESDDDFRRRIQLAPEAYSTAGSAGAYVFHALSADVTIKDATAWSPKPGSGRVTVSIMSSGENPVPTADQVNKVRTLLHDPAIKPLTDMVSVVPATVINVDLKAKISMYPGPDAAVVVSDIQKALLKLKTRINSLGRDLTRSSLLAALSQEGVHDVDLISPAQDILVDLSQCVVIKTAALEVDNIRRE